MVNDDVDDEIHKLNQLHKIHSTSSPYSMLQSIWVLFELKLNYLI